MPMSSAQLLVSQDLHARYVKCRPEHCGMFDVEYQNIDALGYLLNQ